MPDVVKVSHSLDMGPLPDEIVPIARRQGEDPDLTCNYLEELRNLIFERGDFEPLRTDNEFLIKFLRSRFFKVENAYKLMMHYHKFRESNQDLYLDFDPLTLAPLAGSDIVSVTPYYDQNRRRMMFYKIGNWKPSQTPITDLLRAAMVIMEIGSLETSGQVLGGVGIFDFEGLTVNHALPITPSIANKVIGLLTVMPFRIEAVHIINQGWAFDMFFKIFKPFLNKKMRSRIFFHGTDMESLHKHIDKTHLPRKFGGVMDDYPYTTWLHNLIRDSIVVKELKQLGYVLDIEGFCKRSLS